MSSTTGDAKTETLNTGPVGGHLTKKQRKDQFEALGALQTQLEVSVSLTRNKVASWLNTEAFSDDDDDTSNQSGGFTAATVIKPRQPGLGLGAKFISHKDQMRHVPLNAFESKLKRQLTGGKVQSEIQRAEEVQGKNALPDKYMEHKMMMAARRKELQEQAEDEEDSRTRNIGNGLSKKAGAVAVTALPPPNTHQSPTKARSEANPSSKAPSQPIIPDSQKKVKYQASVHPAALKAAPSDHVLEAKAGQGAGKKRAGDFFSVYMDERANKMAKKKKGSAKRDSDDDD
ncbi:hypothetical protein BGX34_003083 [Mortierella sp. NVP85]|nr:hypothetical protein BGX34_003083 [Mortierella sp. NVP85]